MHGKCNSQVIDVFSSTAVVNIDDQICFMYIQIANKEDTDITSNLFDEGQIESL